MKYRQLGQTGLSVSEIGFSTWAIEGTQQANTTTPTDVPSTPQEGAGKGTGDETAFRAIAKAVELGCNFFDSADVYGYGHSETVLAQGLQQIGKLNDVYIATKVGGNFYSGRTVTNFTPEYIHKALHESLKRLNREYIDLYQLHSPNRLTIEYGEIFEVMENLKKDGLIRHYGVTAHNVQDGIACIRTGHPETIQIVYNFYSLTQSSNPAEELFPLAAEQNIGIIVREPLASGLLTKKVSTSVTPNEADSKANWAEHFRSFKLSLNKSLQYLNQPGRTLAQAALRFALDEPGVSTVIVGIKTQEQAIENLGASEIPNLSGEEVTRLKSILLG